VISLDDYLEDADEQPWRWGHVDCVMRPANWIVARTGEDPAAAYRGTYSTQTGAWRLVMRAGGLVTLVGPHLERLGWRRTDDPDSGDVGIVLAAVDQPGGGHSMRPVGALRYGPWWSVRGENFIAFARLETVAAWTLSKA
jgi:hypothetical protein